MDARKINIKNLFPIRTQYAIPPYQRSYCWNRDDNWIPLWEDIKSYINKEVDEDRKHFMGAIIVQDNSLGGRVTDMFVVDGQQRITTIQVFLLALRKQMQKTEYELPETKLLVSSLIKNEVTPQGDPRKLKPSLSDQQAYYEVFNYAMEETRRKPNSGKKG
nr:DUF262 domain-containing protein [Alphaproteobacteria bacterium]